MAHESYGPDLCTKLVRAMNEEVAAPFSDQLDSEDEEDPNDLETDDMGDEDMGDEDMGDEDMGDEDMGDEDMGDDDMGDDDMGDEDMGDEDMGVHDRHKDTMDLMKMMASYCGKYMKAESVYDENHHKMGKKAKCDVKKEKKHCNCESDEFLNSLSKQTQRNGKKPLSEDSLFAKVETETEEDAVPGDIGFAPQGRIGSIGGGYTKADFADIPVLGESNRFPTLTEWAANRSKK
jgi:hypothetical protein